MRQLIVNADDLGADAPRNTGIFEAIESGSVASVSILANGPATREALRTLAGMRGVSCGLHFNLSEGRPVSSGLELLTGPDGSFPGKKSARDRLMRHDPRLADEIRQELRAQAAVLRDAGIRLSHLDGHQHVHILPAALQTVVEEAKEHGIPWIRIPEEEADASYAGTLTAETLAEGAFFSRNAAAARPIVLGMGLRATDHFRGLYTKGRLPEGRWPEFCSALGEGLTEFMVHPGRFAGSPDPGPFSAFSTRDRQLELDALTGSFAPALSRARVQIVPFPEDPR